MKIVNKYLLIAAMATVMVSCKEQKNTQQIIAQNEQKLPVKEAPVVPKGNHVPNDEVCMVNDIHMGKKQMEVPFEGKMYYGCCNMCVERIPSDANVREATDPYTGMKTDKSTAFIVSLNEKGNVAYFESEENYKKFIEANKATKN